VAELIQVDHFLEAFSAPGDMISGRYTQGHTDHHFFIRGYVQDAFDMGLIESADPASSIPELNGLKRELG